MLKRNEMRSGRKKRLRLFKRLLYRNYRISSSLKHWIRRRFTDGGLILLGMIFLTGGLGMDTKLVVAYQVAVLGAVLLGIGLVWSGFPRPRLNLRRILPRYGAMGEPLRYGLEVENPSGRRQASLTVLEDLADPRPVFEDFVNIPEPGEQRRNWFDRTFAYYRWRWLVGRNQVARAKEESLPVLPPRGKVRVECELMPLKRGVLRFTGMTVASADPFGFVRGFRRVAAAGSVLVLPRRYLVPPIVLPGTRKYQQGGVALASSVGESEEIVSLRDYRQGDPLRHIHWKSWAKTGKPIVKEFNDEFFVRHALILDTFIDVEEGARFEEAVSVAASFACMIETQESLLDVLFIGPQAYCFTMGRGLAHAEQMLEILASVNVCTEKPFSALEDLVVDHAAEVSGCICILTGWDQGRRDFIERLKVWGMEMLVLVIVEPGEAEKLEAGPLADCPGAFKVLEAGRIEEGLAGLNLK